MKKTKKLKRAKRSRDSLSASETEEIPTPSLSTPPPPETTKTSSDKPTNQKTNTALPSLDNKTKSISAEVALVSSKNPVTEDKSICDRSKSSIMKLFNINNQSRSSLIKLANRPGNLECDTLDAQKLYETWSLKPGYGRNLDSWEIRCGK